MNVKASLSDLLCMPFPKLNFHLHRTHATPAATPAAMGAQDNGLLAGPHAPALHPKPVSIERSPARRQKALMPQMPRDSKHSVVWDTASHPSTSMVTSTGAASIDAPSAIPEVAAKVKTRGIREVKVGGGPRTEAQILALIQLLREYREQIAAIQQRGGHYKMAVVVLEQGNALRLAKGAAWDDEHGPGTANSAPERAGLDKPGIPSLLDYPKRTVQYMADNKERIMQDCAGNPVREVLLERAFDGSYGPKGEPTTEVAFAPRAELGREAQTTLFNAWNDALKEFPFLRIFMMPGNQVSDIDLSTDPSHPRVHTRKTAVTETGTTAATDKAGMTLKVDNVTLNTGTPMVNPVRDEAVQRHTFCRAMSTEALKKFLGDKNLLDEDGFIKPGTRLAIGGTGLSAVEARNALEPLMRTLVKTEEEPTAAADAPPAYKETSEPDGEPPPSYDEAMGYKVRPEAKEKLHAALTFISKQEGKWISPRHSHGPEGTTNPLGTIEMQHALFLHGQGEEVFKAWALLCDASVAVSQKTTLSAVRPELSTKDLLKAQLASSRRSALARLQAKKSDGPRREKLLQESTQTLEGERRKFALSTLLHLGTASNPAKAVKELGNKAPLTFAGREGYPIYQAMMKAVTQPGTAVANDNAPLMKRAAEWMNDVTASPLFAHASVPLLFEAGIASHVCATYADLHENPDPQAQRPLVLEKDGERHEFDAFIVSPVFDAKADPITESLQGQVKSAVDEVPGAFEVTANRQLVGPDGQPLPVVDNSLRGAGVIDPKTGARLNAYAGDGTNNRETGVDVALRMAYRQLAQLHLSAAGFEDPVRQVEQLYDECIPSEEEFNAETASFEAHYRAAMEMAAFVSAADKAALGNKDEFARLMEVARSGTVDDMKAALESKVSEARRLLQPLSLKAYVQASAQFNEALDKIPPYKPASRKDYFQRFVDLPLHVHERVVARAADMAIERLPGYRYQ